MDTLCASEERRRQEALDGAEQHAHALTVSYMTIFGLAFPCGATKRTIVNLRVYLFLETGGPVRKFVYREVSSDLRSHVAPI